MNELLEILFYGEVTNFSVASLIGRLAEAKNQKANINVLTNSAGGDPDPGFGLIAKMREYPYGKMMTVHGAAYSTAAFAALFVDKVRAIEQAKFLFHRVAAFNMADEKLPVMVDLLTSRNNDLRKAMEEKLDISAFERISGVTLDELFSLENRIDVVLDANQALEIGLVTEIIPLPAREAEEINSRMVMAASANSLGIKPIEIEKRKNKSMDLEKLKKEHPEVYAQALLEARQQPVADDGETVLKKERARVAAWQVWAEVDAKRVADGIASGLEISPKDTQEFMLAQSKKNFAGALKKGTKAPSSSENTDSHETQEDEGMTAFKAEYKQELKKIQKANG